LRRAPDTHVEINDAIGRTLLIQGGAAQFVLANGTALRVDGRCEPPGPWKI
jgi:hypothetical protein